MKNRFFSATLKIAFCFIFAMMSNMAVAQVIHVTPTGAGLMDGSSWTNALDGNMPDTTGFTRLAVAIKSATPGMQFWIAEGTYYSCTDNDREKSFELGQNIRLYGSFQGTETDTLQRNIALHPTVFSGDIGVQDDSTDNSKLIINIVPGNGTEFSFIDGIDILYGYNATWGAYAAGIINAGHLRIANCQINHNQGQWRGGGIENSGELTMQNCNLSYNICSSDGGGLWNGNHAVVINCKFCNNQGGSSGGAIYNRSNISVINSLIANNASYFGWGGGLATDYNVFWGIPSAKIYNSTLANNDGNVLVFGGNISIINSIVWGSGIGLLDPTSGIIDLRYSIIQNYSGNPLVLNANPLFVNPTEGNGSGYNGLAANWSLSWCSPGINTGADSLIPSGITKDLNGNPRILYSGVDLGAYEYDTTGVMMNNINYSLGHLYVSDSAVYMGDGSSWTSTLAGNAGSCRYPGQTLLYEAMKDATPGTEIWIKKGTYSCSLLNNRNHSFDINQGVSVYGGFAENETSKQARNIAINKTIFTGNIGDPLISTDNSYHVMNINTGGTAYADTALLDNIIIEQGYADGSNSDNQGGGININPGTRLKLSSVEIRKNIATGNGSGIILQQGSVANLINCRISMNESFVFPQPYSHSANGTGIFNEGKLKLKDSRVSNNKNATLGTGIFNTDSLLLINTSIDSNVCFESYLPFAIGGGIFNAGYCNISGGTLTGNQAYTRGGGISNMPGATLFVASTVIAGNSCGVWGNSYGGGIYNEGNLAVMKCEIKNNTAPNGGGGISNMGSGSILQSVIAFNYSSGGDGGPIGPGNGGGLYNDGNLIADGCRISNNTSTGNGGGAYNPTTVRNCIIVNNSITGPYMSGGGLWIGSGCQGIFNSTIANNTLEGIYAATADTFPVRNSIVSGNDVQLFGHFILANSCIPEILPGSGNIISNPLWISPSEGKGAAFNGLAADWGLLPYSPCVNKGNNAYLLPSDSLDAKGNPRLMYGTVDIGGNESQVPPDTAMPTLHHVIWEIFRPKPANIQSTDAVPWQSVVLPSLETNLPNDLTTQSRIRGYLLPQVSGYYRFYMASDIGGKLFLSTDSLENNRRLIFSNEAGNENWPGSPGLTDSIFLVGQSPYYFESFSPQNYMKIGWVVPESSQLSVISAEFLKCANPKQQLSIDWELYKNRLTYDFTDLKNTTTLPDEVVKIDSLSTVDHSTHLDFFASRMRGYLFAPVTGTYQFYFACDNVGQFWLSPDSTVAGAVLKSEIHAAQPDWYQHLSTQDLIAGQKYYFGILHYDTAFTDLVKLGWQVPGSTGPEVIKSPFITSCHDAKAAVSLRILDSNTLLYPGWSIKLKFYLTPWNTDFKGIRWTSSNDAVATVDCYGKITAVATGSCRIIASMTEHPAIKDSVMLLVTDYPGPFYAKSDIQPGDGHSWESAGRLDNLLDFLGQGPLPAPVTIFAAEGIYKPTNTIDRNETFHANNMRILGGYSMQSSGTDTMMRSVDAHPTILSGEIGDPGTTIDNSYHVIALAGNVTLDGLTIRDGRASCSTYGSTPGYYVFKPDDNGGGIYGAGTGNLMRNCRIIHNSAWNRGGGIYENGGTIQLDSDELTENLIEQEALTNWGIFILYINGNGAGIATQIATVNATNCIFHHNGPSVGYGSVAFINLNSMGTFTGCSFFSNTGIPADLSATNGSSLNLRNSTVNGSVGFSLSGGNITNSTILGPIMNLVNPYNNNSISCDNSLFTSMGGDIFSAASTAIQYSIIGNTLYGAGKDSILVDNLPHYSTWLDTLAYNGGSTPTMRLKNVPGNPAKIHGNPAYLGTTDQRGYNRSDTVSIGAYQWVRPSQITITPDHANMAPGDSLPYFVSVLPAWADDKTWSAAASDTTIVGIAGNTMLAQSEGNAGVIVHTHDGNRRDTCFVMVMIDSVGVNGTVHNGNSACYSALDVITVAGNATSFMLQAGGNTEMIAGEKILYLPGTTVQHGGYLHGYIAPQGPWCQAYKSTSATPEISELAARDDQKMIRENGFRVYPNPTEGSFTVELLSDPGETPVAIRCYDLTGSLILEKEIVVGRKLGMTLTGWEPGIYVIRITADKWFGYKKIIKTK